MNNLSTKNVGDAGESVGAEFLRRRGFSILDRNYRKKWGEIDIVATKGAVIHFVEVKSVRVSSFDVIHETNAHRPEENVHSLKLKKLTRVIETDILDKKYDEREWQIDVLAVFLNEKTKKARCRFLENIVL